MITTIEVEDIRLMQPRPGCIEIDADMTPEQMFRALQSFLTRIPGPTWVAWQERIAAEAMPV